MKLRKYIFLTVLALLALGGCTNEIESDLNVLERRIQKLEARCQELNTTLSGLRTTMERLQEYDFLTGVQTLTENGRTIGYMLSFTHSDPVTLYNGTDAETPILGVAKGEDGVWYWTVQYPSDPEPVFITDEFGVRITTSAISPQLKIENGYWYVTYDNGEIWRNLGKATGEDGASYFESVTNMGDYIQFNMINGTVIKAPTMEAFEKLKESLVTANENLETFTNLAKTFSEKVYVNNLVPILNGLDTIGMKIVLSDGNAYSFYNGTGTNVPVIGARRLTDDPSDDKWYWTIQYGNDPFQWILNENGEKIQANGQDAESPHLSLQQTKGDPAWYWAVAYGDGQPQFLLYNGQKVKANVDVPETVVQNMVQVRDDMVYVTLSGGMSFFIPMAKAIVVSLSSPVSGNTLTMLSGGQISFDCVVANADNQAEVLPIAHDNFYATAQRTSKNTWIITVKAPLPFIAPSTSHLDLLVSNGYGSMKNISIIIVPAS